MGKMIIQSIESQDEMTSKDKIDFIFNSLNTKLLDDKEITLDFSKITFISVYFLERLEQFVFRAQDLGVTLKIINVQPSIYKVFQIAKSKGILQTCNQTLSARAFALDSVRVKKAGV